MPTRKQRRRRQQKFRHEQAWYEVDESGNEVELDAETVRAARPERSNGAKPAAAPTKGTKLAPQRGRREPQPPSWNRALKRSAILAVFFFVLISFGSRGNVGIAIIQTLPIVLLYVPLMYYMDRWMYRRYQAKQLGAGTPATRKKS